MLINRHREKLLNAIIFFSENTAHCGKTKLFKLLYFLDFQHYQETGKSVTGLEYYAWPKGPVPRELFEELNNPSTDLVSAMAISEEEFAQNKRMLKIQPKISFSEDGFTKRELRILTSLAKQYKHSNADKMIEETHFENLPWHKVYEKEGNKQAKIPYQYAIRGSEEDIVTAMIEAHEEFLGNY